jgi:ABC-type glutathione transport system ATPase component
MRHILGIFLPDHKATRRKASIPPLMTSPAPELTVSARGLSRHYGIHAAVRGIDIEVRHGEVLGLLGPNGAGKTTTMRMLTGNLPQAPVKSAYAASTC